MNTIIFTGDNLSGKSYSVSVFVNEEGFKEVNLHLSSYFIFNKLLNIYYMKKFYIDMLYMNRYPVFDDKTLSKIKFLISKYLFENKYYIDKFIEEYPIFRNILIKNPDFDYNILGFYYNNLTFFCNYSIITDYKDSKVKVPFIVDVFDEVVFPINEDQKDYLRYHLNKYFEKCYMFQQTFDFYYLYEINTEAKLIFNYISDLFYKSNVLFWFNFIKPFIYHYYESKYDIVINNVDYEYELLELNQFIGKNLGKNVYSIFIDNKYSSFDNKFGINYLNYKSQKQKELEKIKLLSGKLITNQYDENFNTQIKSI